MSPQATPALARPTPSDQAQASPQPTEVLAGSIERVTFHNADNGFCVLRIKARGHRDLVTVVGHAAEISAGEWVTVSGTWVNHRLARRRRQPGAGGHRLAGGGGGRCHPYLFLGGGCIESVPGSSKGQLVPGLVTDPLW